MGESLITIIVPVYNVENYVEKCVESIIDQTYRNLEIILVDDGSTDASGRKCDEYKDKDPRVVVIHKKNGGLSDARNFGLDVAKGDFIGFVDSDDIIHPQMYDILYQLLEKEKCEISGCLFERDWDGFSKREYNTISIKYEVFNKSEALKNEGTIWATVCNKLYRREIFDNIRFPVGRIHEDEFVFHKTIWECNKYLFVNEKMYFYTNREGSLQREMTRKSLVDATDALRERIDFSSKHNWQDVLPKVIELYCMYCKERYIEIDRGVYKEIDPDVKDYLLSCIRNAIKEYGKLYSSKKLRFFLLFPRLYMALYKMKPCGKRE